MLHHDLFVRVFVEWCCRTGFDKSAGGQTQLSNKSALQEQKADKGVFCAGCQAQLSGHEQAMEFAGGHRHVFVNPGGVEFEIALYREVSCLRHGPLTPEYTWFAGYAWQIVLCPTCHRHLGWRYRRADSPDFYGLITDRILVK
jgi:hypothetical protein